MVCLFTYEDGCIGTFLHKGGTVSVRPFFCKFLFQETISKYKTGRREVLEYLRIRTELGQLTLRH